MLPVLVKPRQTHTKSLSWREFHVEHHDCERRTSRQGLCFVTNCDEMIYASRGGHYSAIVGLKRNIINRLAGVEVFVDLGQ